MFTWKERKLSIKLDIARGCPFTKLTTFSVYLLWPDSSHSVVGCGEGNVSWYDKLPVSQDHDPIAAQLFFIPLGMRPWTNHAQSEILPWMHQRVGMHPKCCRTNLADIIAPGFVDPWYLLLASPIHFEQLVCSQSHLITACARQEADRGRERNSNGERESHQCAGQRREENIQRHFHLH